jgi:MYXO-CTERM domain-containing protein
MTRLNVVCLGLLSLASLLTTSARADIVLESYEFNGQAGSETSLSPATVATGLTGVNFTESSVLTPSTGANSINASGWQNAGAYYALGFNVSAGYTATVDQIVLADRSSNTGPGTINILASADGGAFVVVGSTTQTGTTYNDLQLSITAVTASKSLVFEFVAANQASAGGGGGTIGSSGTFRVGDYAPTGGTAAPFSLNGTVTAVTAVPEPSSLALGLIALAALAPLARRRALRGSRD